MRYWLVLVILTALAVWLLTGPGSCSGASCL